MCPRGMTAPMLQGPMLPLCSPRRLPTSSEARRGHMKPAAPTLQGDTASDVMTSDSIVMLCHIVMWYHDITVLGAGAKHYAYTCAYKCRLMHTRAHRHTDSNLPQHVAVCSQFVKGQLHPEWTNRQIAVWGHSKNIAEANRSCKKKFPPFYT